VRNWANNRALIWTHLLRAQTNFEEHREDFPLESLWMTLPKPLANDVDLILPESTGNDYQAKEAKGGYLTSTKVLLRYLLNSNGRGRGEPNLPWC